MDPAMREAPSPICLTCNPDAWIDEDDPHVFSCMDCDDLDLEEYEENRRRKLAERNEY